MGIYFLFTNYRMDQESPYQELRIRFLNHCSGWSQTKLWGIEDLRNHGKVYVYVRYCCLCLHMSWTFCLSPVPSWFRFVVSPVPSWCRFIVSPEPSWCSQEAGLLTGSHRTKLVSASSGFIDNHTYVNLQGEALVASTVVDQRWRVA